MMKHLLLTTIAAVLLVGCGPSLTIHEAASDGNIEVVKQHIAAGTDVNTKDSVAGLRRERGWTPLHYAADKGRKEIAELLIANGADVNATDGDGYTPLHDAASLGHKEVVELLIANEADMNAKNNYGRTPLDWVIDFHDLAKDDRKGKYKEIADLLRKHGGKTAEELK